MEQEADRAYAFVVPSEGAAQRIDAFLASQVARLTRSRIQGLIREGRVEVNGLPPKPSYRVKGGDEVVVCVPPPVPPNLEPEPVGFVTVYEDSSLIVLDKPSGLVIHPAPGHPRGTLVHGLLGHCKDLSGVGGVLRPGIVHRLDKDTTGLMVVAKSNAAHLSLSAQFKAGKVKKRYMALVHGVPSKQAGSIDQPIGRHPKRRKEMAVVPLGGRPALTLWERVEQIGGEFALLAASPRTGRTHQIRVHLSHAGHPIVGDPVYGHRRGWWKRHHPNMEEAMQEITRQMLHAETLGFMHPESGLYCEFRSPMPADMNRVIDALKFLSAEKGLDKKGFCL